MQEPNRSNTESVESVSPKSGMTAEPVSGSGTTQVRTRRKPQISEMPPPPPPPPTLADYESIIGKSQLDELRLLARALAGKRVKMVNSTALGGGVAEMLNRLIPLLNELEIKTGHAEAGRQGLAAVEKDASAAGFALVARKSAAGRI